MFFIINFTLTFSKQSSMSFSGLSELEFLNGLFSLIIVVVSIMVGLRLCYKFFTHKIKELITMGVAWILLFTLWWGNSISFIFSLLLGHALDMLIYITIEHVFMPFALVLWIYSFCSLMYPIYLKKVMGITSAACLIELILILVAIFQLLEIHGTNLTIIDSKSSPILFTIKIFNIIIFTISSFMYGLNLLSEVDKKIRLKGKFFIIGVSSFSIGAFLSLAFFSLLELSLIRLLLLSSSIEFYLSFLMPERMGRWILKEEISE